MNEPLMHVTTRQIAVGQGGLMHCEIACMVGPMDQRLSVVFDCGSFNREALEEGIESIEGDVVDILFISHLDADHVNGIDHLMNAKEVDTVVLPCLDAAETIVMVARSLAGGGLTGDFLRFVEDPVRWLGERGAKRVVIIGRPGSGEEGPLPRQPVPPPTGEEGAFWIEPSRTSPRMPWKILSRDGPPKVTPAGRGSQVEVVETAPLIEMEAWPGVMAANGRAVVWLLVPYVHPFDPVALGGFRHAARRVLGMDPKETAASADFRRRLVRKLADRAVRRELKACYRLLASHHNEVSMSLYSGPFPQIPEGSWRQDLADEGWIRMRGSLTYRPAWMSTGDANLKTARTRDAWILRYHAYLDNVGVFVLPHHGSHHNLSAMVLDLIGAAAYIACAKADNVHHPSENTLAFLKQRQLQLSQVSEDVATGFVSTVALH